MLGRVRQERPESRYLLVEITFKAKPFNTREGEGKRVIMSRAFIEELSRMGGNS